MQTAVLHAFHSLPAIRPGDFHAAITPLLDVALTELNSQGAYLHSVDLADWTARLIVWSGLSPLSARVPIKWQGNIVKSRFSCQMPLVLHAAAWEHPTFAALQEFQKNRFDGVISIPVLDMRQLAGLLSICRSGRTGLKPHEFSFLLNLAASIGDCWPRQEPVSVSSARWTN